VQQNCFVLILCVCLVAVSGSTFEPGTHRMSGTGGYMKDLLGPEGCKNVCWILLLLVTLKPPLSAIFAIYKSYNVFHMILFILQVCYMCVENTFVWTCFFEAGIIHCFFIPTWKCSSLPDISSLFQHCFFAVVFNNTLLKDDWGNLYNSTIWLFWCYDLLLIRVSQTCLSC
jgi:hypothetical protein